MAREEVLQALLSRGVPQHIAQGMLGNISVESGFNPGINEINPTVPGSRGGFGLFQHTGPRRRALEAFAQQSGRPLGNIDTQVDFALQELGTTESRAGRALSATTTAEEAARVFSEQFLRPGVPHLDRRIAAATGITGGAGDDTLQGGLSITPQRGQGFVPHQQQQRGGLAGLLGGGGERPGFLQEGGLLDPDRRDRLVAGLEGLTLNPNTALQQQALQSIDARKRQRTATEQANKTGEFLRSRGRDDLAGAVESGAIPAQAAVQVALAPASAQGRIVSGADAAALGLDPNNAYNVTTGSEGTKATQIGGSGTTVNIEGQPQVGTIPPGFQLEKDPNTGAFTMTPIQGGPADKESQAIAAAAAEALSQGEIKRSVVDDQIDTALKLMERKGALDAPEAGIVGAALAGLGVNQEAVDLKNTLAGIQATVAFDTLQKMREASASGGALGSVSEREIDLLISAYGALQQSTSPDLLRKNLNTVKRLMGKIANDPVASQFISRDNAPPAGGSGRFVIRGRVD